MMSHLNREIQIAKSAGKTLKTRSTTSAGTRKSHAWTFSTRTRRRRAALGPADAIPATATVGDDSCAMPIYDHLCDHCGHAFSVVRSFDDPPVEHCPACGERPRRLIALPAIVFKGSGWYKTDSRP